LHVACGKGHLPVIKFLLDSGSDINKQDPDRFSPLHQAIYGKQFKACELILKYEQVSNQNIESGITMSRIEQAPEIQALLENALKKRRKVILVCYCFAVNVYRARSIQNYPKRSATSAKRSLGSVKSVANARSRSTVARYVIYLVL
jgi:hypothetical protein